VFLATSTGQELRFYALSKVIFRTTWTREPDPMSCSRRVISESTSVLVPFTVTNKRTSFTASRSGPRISSGTIRRFKSTPRLLSSMRRVVALPESVCRKVGISLRAMPARRTHAPYLYGQDDVLASHIDRRTNRRTLDLIC